MSDVDWTAVTCNFWGQLLHLGATGIIRKCIEEKFKRRKKEKRKWLHASHAKGETDNKTSTGKDKHTI